MLVCFDDKDKLCLVKYACPFILCDIAERLAHGEL